MSRIAKLRAKETKLGRLLITDKISEETYEQLRAEWKDKLRSASEKLANLERDVSRYNDDLDIALILMTQLSTLFDRLDDKAKHKLLQIMVNRIIVDPDGRIVDYELNRPFGYLSKLANDPNIELNGQAVRSRSPLGYKFKILEYSPMMGREKTNRPGCFSLNCGSSLRCGNRKWRRSWI